MSSLQTTTPRASRRLVTGFLLLCAVLWAAPALAEEGEATKDCTWFPDFRCGRHGRYEGFVMPMQMPFLFEEPFITTGVQAVGIWNQYPDGSVFDGGHMWVAALQARIAITDRLAFIATKDGWAEHRPGSASPINDADGFFDISAGFKYAVIDMPEKNFILTPSFRIDMPTGQNEIFSGNGDGVAIPAVAAAWGWNDFHVIGDFGGRFPFSSRKESNSLFWNLHLDYAVLPFFVPFFEAGGMHWTASGKSTFLGVSGFEGIDVVNLGSTNVTGHDVVIATFGVRFPIGKHLQLGGSYDFPMTGRKDIWEQRATLSAVVEF